jgi:carbonic anhydrase/acetyltransferase-like protein (isoleucine patch superfamily)
MALIKAYRGIRPQLGKRVFLAESASVTGDVVVGDDCNIWYGCVVRGDVGKIRFGRRVNLQDLSCVHTTENLSEALVDDDVSMGHGVILHGAIIEAGVLVGMGSVLMDNARIGAQSIIGAGSLVTAGTIIPPRSLAFGRPAKVVRSLDDKELLAGKSTAEKYVKLGREHGAEPLIET